MAREGMQERRALSILWRIEKFNCCKNGRHQSGIRTFDFRPSTLNRIRLYLRLLPNGDAARKEHLRLSLNLHTFDKALDYPIDCEYSFLDYDESPMVSGTVRNKVIHSDSPLDLPDCPTMEEMFDTKQSSFLLHGTLTVRCRIWKSGMELDQAEHFSLLTRIDTREQSLVWPIERFSTLQLGQNVTTRVDLYSACSKEGIQLKISLTGTSLRKSVVNCEITENGSSKEVLTVAVSVFKDGQKSSECGEKKLEFNRSRTCCFPKFVSRKELLVKKSDCVRRDVLNLRFVFSYLTGSYFNYVESVYIGPSNLKTELPRNDVNSVSEANCQTTQQSVDTPDISEERIDSLVTLGEDFLSVYRDSHHADFELLSGDIPFPVHKLVLSARSPFFRAMFTSDKVSASNFLDVPNVDANTLNRMLTFLYAGTVEHLQWEEAVKLYCAADKYVVQSLKQQCSAFLQFHITVSNVSDILTLAERHRDAKLTSFVQDFIFTYYDEIMQSGEWESFVANDPSFSGKTMHRICKKRLQLNKRQVCCKA